MVVCRMVSRRRASSVSSVRWVRQSNCAHLLPVASDAAGEGGRAAGLGQPQGDAERQRPLRRAEAEHVGGSAQAAVARAGGRPDADHAQPATAGLDRVAEAAPCSRA